MERGQGRVGRGKAMPRGGGRAGRATGTVCTVDPMSGGLSIDYRYTIDTSDSALRTTFRLSLGCARVLWAALGFLDGGRILPLLPHVEVQLMGRSSPIIDV